MPHHKPKRNWLDRLRPAPPHCVACGRPAKRETGPIHHLFIARRYGTTADQVGSRFFFRCPEGEGFLCLDCLGLRDGPPVPPADIETHPFTCPACGTPAALYRSDHTMPGEAVAHLLDVERTAAAPALPPATVLVAIEEYRSPHPLPVRRLLTGGWGPLPRPLRPGEAWETHLRVGSKEDDAPRLVLAYTQQPGPHVTVAWEDGGTRRHLGRLDPGGLVTRDALVARGVPGSDRLPALLLSGDHGGYQLSLMDESVRLWVWNVGICAAASETGLEPLPASREVMAHPPHRDDMATRLKWLTDNAVWDYMWLEHPRPGEEGPEAVVAVCGSTDLTYYEIVRIRFTGARFSTCPNFFSHPKFRLATESETRHLMQLCDFGPRSLAMAITRDFGGHLQGVSHIVADAVDYIDARPDNIDEAYVPANPAHVDWWIDR